MVGGSATAALVHSQRLPIANHCRQARMKSLLLNHLDRQSLQRSRAGRLLIFGHCRPSYNR
jgi:hypothetical protein